MNLKKMQNVSEMYVRQFVKAATELVMDEVGETSEDNKNTIAMFTARDMAIGALMKRNEHILTGVGIGAVGTALAFTIGNKFKKKKNEVVIQFTKEGLDEMEEMLKDQKKTFEEEAAASEQPDITEDVEDIMEEQVKEDDEQVEEEQSIIDKVNDILKKPSNLEDLKAVIEELRNNEK